MTQSSRRSEYKSAAPMACYTPLAPPASCPISATNKASPGPEAAAAGNGSGLLARMEAAPAVVLVTSWAQTLGQSLDEVFLRPLRATTLIRSEQSQCFHYQPTRAISMHQQQQTASSRTISPVPIPCTYKLDAVISRTSISSSISTSAPLGPRGVRGFCRLLFTLSLVAGLCLMGAQSAPTTGLKRSTENQVSSATTEASHEKPPPPPPPPTTTTMKTHNQESFVVIELDDRRPAQANELVQPEKESQVSDDDTILLVLTDSSPRDASSLRRLIKRSGISDQRLAEIQMIRALKKQLEKASKIAASNLNSAGQESTSS